MRRFLIVCALAGLVAGQLAPTVAARSGLTATPLTPISTYSADKSLSGRLAQSDENLLQRHDSKIVNVVVKLDADAVASYAGGVDGLTATSPGVTGKTLADNGSAVDAYTSYLASKMLGVRQAARQSVSGLRLGRNFLIVYGGFAASLPANQAKVLARVPGVAAVQYDSLQHPTVDYSQHFVGADAVWASVGGPVLAGAGVKVGVIDTGIWPEHPMLADLGLPAMPGSYNCEFGLSSNPDDASFTCNDKMLGAYAFMDTYEFVQAAGADEYCDASLTSIDHPYGTCSARDADGHGTHTSTTAVGDGVASAVLNGVERGPLSGIAPGASLIMYRVCGSQGCYSTDSMHAVEQAIIDDVDVINFSISGGANPYTDPVELAFLDAYAAGIEVNASAGNAGPGAGTTDHGGPWTNTIGASTWDKAFDSTLHLAATGPTPATLDLVGVTVTDGIASPTPVVLAGDTYCLTPASPGTYTGEVVVCERGPTGPTGNARIDKGYNVSLGDAAGMILYNQSAGVTDIETDNHFLPAIHVNYNSDAVASFVSSHTGVTAWWTTGVVTAAQGDVMASFSSRGPLGDFIKPDVTAPGVQILAGNSPKHLFDPEDGLGPNDELYQAIAGTSMSSPHAAGVAALIKAAHPSWTPGEIKSAMMTSAVNDVVKEDGVTPADPFDDGAGSIRANRAVKPTVVFNVLASAYYNTTFNNTTSVVLDRINLNLPSIDAPIMPGVITATRTAKNVSGHNIVLDMSAVAPAGSSIKITPKVLAIPKGMSRSFTVRIEGSGLADGWYFGSITLNSRTAGDLNAVLPVAFNKTQGEVTFDNTCDDASVAKGAETTCHATATNLADESADLSIGVQGTNNRIKVNDWAVSDQGDPGRPQANKRGNGFLWDGWLSPSLPPTVDSITDITGGGPDGGYLALSLFGIPSIGAGDDTITNFNVPTFYYGGEAYTRIGVVSNGYVVVGGGTSSDIVYVPQTFPNPASPNNVLAPLWTDLNPPAGGAIRVATLSGGGYAWIVIDWDGVKNFGNATTHSFELWLQESTGAHTGPTSEAITYSYGPNLSFPTDGPGLANAGSGDPSSGVNWGAENRTGTSGVSISPAPTNGSEWSVNTSPPTPGGTVTIDYDVLGKKVGSSSLRVLMWSDVVAGTTKIVTPISVTP